jgi:hypothetical protein
MMGRDAVREHLRGSLWGPSDTVIVVTCPSGYWTGGLSIAFSAGRRQTLSSLSGTAVLYQYRLSLLAGLLKPRHVSSASAATAIRSSVAKLGSCSRAVVCKISKSMDQYPWTIRFRRHEGCCQGMAGNFSLSSAETWAAASPSTVKFHN